MTAWWWGTPCGELLQALEGDYPSLSQFKAAAGQLDQLYLTTRYPDALAGGVPAHAFAREQAEGVIARAAAIYEEARRLVDANLPALRLDNPSLAP